MAISLVGYFFIGKNQGECRDYSRSVEVDIARVDQCGDVKYVGTGEALMSAFCTQPEAYGKTGKLIFEWSAEED